MPQITRPDRHYWSDLLVALGGSESYLTRSYSERQLLVAIRNTYASPISTRSISDKDALLASVVNAAGGSASHLRQSKHQMLAALVTALGGTAPDPLRSSTGELLAEVVNAADTGGGGPEWLPEGAVLFSDFAAGHYYAGGAERALGDVWEENTDWSVWNPALVTSDGITAHATDAAPTMSRDYSAAILAGNFYVRMASVIDSSVSCEIAATTLPGPSSHREVDPAGTSSTANYVVQDFADLSETVNTYRANPNITTVVAITPTTIRVSQNGAAVQSYSPAAITDPLTDLAIGILGSGGSVIKSVTYWTGVPSDGAMQALSLVGAAAAPVNVTPPHITDITTDAVLDTAGEWSGNPFPPPPDTDHAYQWYRNGVAIDGETNNYHTYIPEDSGQAIKVRETATNPSGATGADSNTVTAP